MGARPAPAPLVHAARHAPGGADEVFSPEQVSLGHGDSGRTVRSNMPKHANLSNGPANLTSGTMAVTDIPLKAGDVINFLAFRSSTLMTTPAHWWFALYDAATSISAAALLAQTADQLTTAWAANTTKLLQLASTVTIPTTGRYRAGVMVQGGTPGGILGPFAQGALWTVLSYGSSIQIGGTVGAGALTTTAPATLAGLAATGNADIAVLAASHA